MLQPNSVSRQDPSEKHHVLLLVAHEPQRDPRLNWIASGGREDFIIHQLGISRVANDKPSESGSDHIGRVWSYPRIETSRNLAVIRENIFSRDNSAAMLELSSLIAILSLHDSELLAVLGCEDSGRMVTFRWYVKYLLQMTYSLVDHAENISGISAVISTDLDTLLAGMVLKERWGVPLIYDAHEFWPAADVEQEAFEHDFWVTLEGRLVRHVDYAQTVSPGLADHMARLYGVPFESVPNAEPLGSRVAEGQEKTRGEHTGSECRFLFQGGFANARGIDLLISAWPHTHPSAILVLRGPDNEYKKRMVDLAISCGVYATRVLFLEAIDESELVTAAVEFDVGLVPYTPTGLNYSNCCPNKLSQYMAAGLPILAATTNYVSQIISESGAGVVIDFADRFQLVREIDRLALDPALRMAYAEKSAAFFLDRFHWENVSKIFYTRLAELIKSANIPSFEKLSHDRRLNVFPEIVVEEPPVIEQLPVIEEQLVPARSRLSETSFRFARRLWILVPVALRARIRAELQLWIR